MSAVAYIRAVRHVVAGLTQESLCQASVSRIQQEGLTFPAGKVHPFKADISEWMLSLKKGFLFEPARSGMWSSPASEASRGLCAISELPVWPLLQFNIDCREYVFRACEQDRAVAVLSATYRFSLLDGELEGLEQLGLRRGCGQAPLTERCFGSFGSLQM